MKLKKKLLIKKGKIHKKKSNKKIRTKLDKKKTKWNKMPRD